jgi:hypothetical protein
VIKEMMKKRVLIKIIDDFKVDLEKSKNGNPEYNTPIQITIDRIKSFSICFIEGFSVRCRRQPFLIELDKIKSDLRKTKEKEKETNYNKGIKIAIDKIKNLQDNLLYEHEKNPKSTLYYKDII